MWIKQLLFIFEVSSSPVFLEHPTHTFLSTLHDIEQSPFIFQLMESAVLHLLFMLSTQENIQWMKNHLQENDV